MLSIIIPTLNAAQTLDVTLKALAEKAGDIIIADGGSTDGTVEMAESIGARTIVTAPNRGHQLAEGAKLARGEWFLFLHADTVLSDGWHGAARAFMLAPKSRARAAAYRLRLDDPSEDARRIEALAHWRARVLGLPYGDQGLLISRSLYDHLGGFKPYPVMEDVDMVRRVGRAFITIMGVNAVTSADKYRSDGWWARPLSNLGLLSLFFLGVPPEILAEKYK